MYTKSYEIAIGKCITDPKDFKNAEVTYNQFKNLIVNPPDIPNRFDKRRAAYILVGPCTTESRSAAGVLEANIVVLDLDKSIDLETGETTEYAPSKDVILKYFRDKEIFCFYYSTVSSKGGDKSRGRIIIPLLRSLKAKDYKTLVINLITDMQENYIPIHGATENLTLSQCWIIPYKNEHYDFDIIEGNHIDIDKYLSKGTSYEVPSNCIPKRDTSSITHSPYGNETNKFSEIGFFIHNHNNIDFFIDTLLETGLYELSTKVSYADGSHSARLKLISSKSPPGVVVYKYNHKYYVKSHHANDTFLLGRDDKHTPLDCLDLSARFYMHTNESMEFKTAISKAYQEDRRILLAKYMHDNLCYIRRNDASVFWLERPSGFEDKPHRPIHRKAMGDALAAATYKSQVSKNMKTISAFEVWYTNKSIYPRREADNITWIPLIQEEDHGATSVVERMIEDPHSGLVKCNTYRGPFFKRPPGGEHLKLFLDTIEYLCGDQTDLVLDVLSYLIVNPSKKSGVAILLLSHCIQGHGKSWFGNLVRNVFGRNNTSTTDINIVSGVKSQFTSDRANKRILIVDEVSPLSKYGQDTENQVYNNLKALITEDTSRQELKGVDSAQLRDYSQLFLFSNNLQCLRMPAEDRRFIVCVNSKPVLPKSHWAIVYPALDNSEALAEFYWFLRDRGETDGVKNIPNLTAEDLKSTDKKILAHIVSSDLEDWLREEIGCESPPYPYVTAPLVARLYCAYTGMQFHVEGEKLIYKLRSIYPPNFNLYPKKIRWGSKLLNVGNGKKTIICIGEQNLQKLKRYDREGKWPKAMQEVKDSFSEMKHEIMKLSGLEV